MKKSLWVKVDGEQESKVEIDLDEYDFIVGVVVLGTKFTTPEVQMMPFGSVVHLYREIVEDIGCCKWN